MLYGNDNGYEWADPATCDPLRHWLLETAADIDCPEDCYAMPDEELMGLTVLERPHITGAGSIVESRIT